MSHDDTFDVILVCPSLLQVTRFSVLAILANSFFKLLEKALTPLIYRVIFFQELNPRSTSQLQAKGCVSANATAGCYQP